MLFVLIHASLFKTCPHQKNKSFGHLSKRSKFLWPRTKQLTVAKLSAGASNTDRDSSYSSSKRGEDRAYSEITAANRSLLDRAKKVKSVCIVGATGFVGQQLVTLLAKAGVELTIVTRDVARAKATFGKYERRGYSLQYCQLPSLVLDQDVNFKACLAKKDAVVNLAGAPIAGKRWSEAYKDELISSRVRVTQKIVEMIMSMDKEERPKVLINASAVGYYGVSDSKEFDESSPPGDDFLAVLCRKWESAARQLDQSFGTRVVILRFGIVVGSGGGVLGSMTPIFQMFLGGPVGTGRQWISWIQIMDLVNLIIRSITDENMLGVFNACSPEPVTMNDFCETLGNIIGRPNWLPVPTFVIRAMLGEGSIVVLEGQRVYPSRTLASGFHFQYPNIYSALEASINVS
ncbi:cell division inhibitor [Galdieria sulphuraria]|uniref:Cell division inhibitor n=1 Tax=Galdieria sulphuraria TaxID=130081 RepID=M2Y109_GALSU|nr:cell division inhibitor [Galdieria sulphuraria]EME29613.1 cell division inhibitor [Galdieria sulphuraria]|eukprot:XP_005706133.1 cell division inhibitor [Galdieria sulphuraria]